MGRKLGNPPEPQPTDNETKPKPKPRPIKNAAAADNNKDPAEVPPPPKTKLLKVSSKLSIQAVKNAETPKKPPAASQKDESKVTKKDAPSKEAPKKSKEGPKNSGASQKGDSKNPKDAVPLKEVPKKGSEGARKSSDASKNVESKPIEEVPKKGKESFKKGSDASKNGELKGAEEVQPLPKRNTKKGSDASKNEDGVPSKDDPKKESVDNEKPGPSKQVPKIILVGQDDKPDKPAEVKKVSVVVKKPPVVMKPQSNNKAPGSLTELPKIEPTYQKPKLLRRASAPKILQTGKKGLPRLPPIKAPPPVKWNIPIKGRPADKSKKTKKSTDVVENEEHKPLTKWEKFKIHSKKNANKSLGLIYYLILTLRGDERVGDLQLDPVTGRLVLTGIDNETDANEASGANEATVEENVLPYSQELHNVLSIMWVPVEFTGRLPFRVKILEGKAVINYKKGTRGYVRCVIATALLWVLLIWFCFGLCCIFFLRGKEDEPGSDSNSTNITTTSSTTIGTTTTDGTNVQSAALQKKQNDSVKAIRDRNALRVVELKIFGDYWIDLFIFFLTLFMLVFASTNQLITGKIYARFVRNWYKALDQSKVIIHSSLRRYIIVHYVLLCLLILLMIFLFLLDTRFPAMTRVSELIIAAYFGPFIPVTSLRDSAGLMYFQHIGFIGLIIYIVVVVLAWFNTLVYLVFCRCFLKGLRCMNQRVKMICQPDDEPTVGPNAVRVNMMEVHSDYVGIVFAGLAQSKTFGYVLFWDTAATLVLIIVECGILSYYGQSNPTEPHHMWRFENPYPGTKIRQTDPGIAHVLNSFGHFCLTLLRILVVVWAPAENYREGRVGYDLVTYKGLMLAKTQLERNFVRSIWILSLPKYPFVINAKGFIRMTRGMMIAFMANAFTYFVFMVQSREQLISVDKPEAFNPRLKHMFPNGTIISIEEWNKIKHLISTSVRPPRGRYPKQH